MNSRNSGDKFVYYFYEVDAISQPPVVPYDRFVKYVRNHPGTQFFLFVDRCTKDKLDSLLNNDHVTVHWHKDMTPEIGTDPISVIIQYYNPTKQNFGAILAIESSVSPEELSSICYATEVRSAGTLIIAKNSILPDNICQYYENTFNSIEREDCEPFWNAVGTGWEILSFHEDNEGDMGPPHRPGYLSVYSDSDIDESFFDWGIVRGRHIIRH